MRSRFFTVWAPRFSALIGRRSASGKAAPTRCFLVLGTVDTASVTALRHDVMATCGDKLESMRIEACDHGRRMKVRLQIESTGADEVIDTVVRRLVS